jgi:hypothetical protein
VTQDNNANNLAIQNSMLKQKQQQEGSAGLSSLFGTDLSGAKGMDTIANSALNTELGAAKDEYGAEQNGLHNIMGLASGAMGGIGNLDATGGSSPMEQLMNFAGGA